MWPFSRNRTAIEIPKDKDFDIVEKNFQATLDKLSDLSKVRKEYEGLSKRIKALKVVPDDARIPVIGMEGAFLTLDDRIEYEDNGLTRRIYFNIMKWDSIQKYPLSLLKRSFIKWAEKEFGFGYNALVGA